MTAGEDATVISHPIGSNGGLTVRLVDGSVRVRGSDGGEARVEARAANHSAEASGDLEADGVLRVDRTGSELRITVADVDRGPLGALGRLVGRGRSRIDFDIALPRTATLRLSGVSADAAIRGMRGHQELRTVTGDLSLDDVAGELSLHSVSGDMQVRGGAVTLHATTTSGDLNARVERLDEVRVKSVSGDIRLAGELAAQRLHTVESVSGDLELAPASGARIRASTVSGSIHSDLPYTRGPEGGHGSLIVGDGAAELSFRSLSGDMTIVGAQRPAAPADPVDELAILRAVERGEMDVDSASRLLEGAGPRV